MTHFSSRVTWTIPRLHLLLLRVLLLCVLFQRVTWINGRLPEPFNRILISQWPERKRASLRAAARAKHSWERNDWKRKEWNSAVACLRLWKLTTKRRGYAHTHKKESKARKWAFYWCSPAASRMKIVAKKKKKSLTKRLKRGEEGKEKSLLKLFLSSSPFGGPSRLGLLFIRRRH